MKPTLATILIALALCLTGCSSTKTVNLLADKWEVGQHRTCLFGHDGLFCLKSEEWQDVKISSLRGKARYMAATTGQMPPSTSKTPLLDALTVLQVTPYRMKQMESQVTDKTIDAASYETQFASHTPMDYSLWDCYKTGVGSPAVSCSLTEKPTDEQASGFQKQEQRQTMLHDKSPFIVAYLKTLTPEKVIASCGEVTTFDDYKKFLDVEFGKDHVTTPGAIYKASYGAVYVTYSDVSFEWFQGTISKVNGWYESQSTADRAADAVQDVPCVMNHIAEVDPRLK